MGDNNEPQPQPQLQSQPQSQPQPTDNTQNGAAVGHAAIFGIVSICLGAITTTAESKRALQWAAGVALAAVILSTVYCFSYQLIYCLCGPCGVYEKAKLAKKGNAKKPKRKSVTPITATTIPLTTTTTTDSDVADEEIDRTYAIVVAEIYRAVAILIVGLFQAVLCAAILAYLHNYCNYPLKNHNTGSKDCATIDPGTHELILMLAKIGLGIGSSSAFGSLTSAIFSSQMYTIATNALNAPVYHPPA